MLFSNLVSCQQTLRSDKEKQIHLKEPSRYQELLRSIR